jgi:hypothetical protein
VRDAVSYKEWIKNGIKWQETTGLCLIVKRIDYIICCAMQ